ncbi:MAG: HDOD domain-containing protein [Bdellovibrionales bacterium]|nr:HDOD domain-containing protein [Bdellovibrionales bacterium]
MKKQVLFVDDESNILNGLKRMLRPMRDKWDMEFAGGGDEALDLVQRKCFDVIVTDIKMPQVNGATLLSKVKEICPFTVRLVLSGQAEIDSIFQVINSSHQFISKPCDPDVLSTRIINACNTRELLGSKEVKEIVSEFHSVPVLSQNLYAIRSLLQDENSNINQIAESVKKDIGLAVKVLHLVNSSYFGRAIETGNITKAVEILGKDLLKTLVFDNSTFRTWTADPDVFCYERTTDHSVRVAEFAYSLAKLEEISIDKCELAYTAGLLHELGRVLLAEKKPAVYKKIRSMVESGNYTLVKAEKELFTSSHPEIGAYLLSLWNLPKDIVDTIIFHKQPESYPHNEFNILSAVYVANTLDNCLNPAPRFRPSLILDEHYIQKLGKLHRIDEWRSLVETKTKELK